MINFQCKWGDKHEFKHDNDDDGNDVQPDDGWSLLCYANALILITTLYATQQGGFFNALDF